MSETRLPKDDIITRLLANCVGTPATVEWPHRLLHDAVAEIEGLRRQLEEAKASAYESRVAELHAGECAQEARLWSRRWKAAASTCRHGEQRLAKHLEATQARLVVAVRVLKHYAGCSEGVSILAREALAEIEGTP